MPKIEAVCWDFGGVFSASPFATVALIGKEKGYDAERFFDAVFGAYDGDSDHPWHQLERGEIDFMTAREGIMKAARAQGMEADPIELFTRMGSEGTGIRQEVVSLASRLKTDGLKTAIVTNNAKEFRDSWTKSVPLDEICHVVVDSSEIGIRKPDRRIFEHALVELGDIAPERTLFVDDFAANVHAANAVGMQGVLMGEEYELALGEIERLVQLRDV